jgi:excisionase family DNA binding protein
MTMVDVPNESINTNNLLTAVEVAQRLKISRALAYQLMKTGEIRSVRIRNKIVRVYEPDLQEYILRCRKLVSTLG